MGSRAGYIPAAGHDWLLPLYDPVLRWVMREEIFKQRLIDQANIEPDAGVLDLGCGTATLSLLITRRHPTVRVCGLDGDHKVLRIAAAKVAGNAFVSLTEGLAHELPFRSAAFDRVVSSLVLHHLSHAEKTAALRAAERALKPGGSIHVVDFGPPTGVLGRIFALLAHSNDRLQENLHGRLVDLLADAGFERAEECGRHATPFGSLSFYRGFKTQC